MPHILIYIPSGSSFTHFFSSYTPANTNVFLTLAQRCGLVIFCFNVARTFLERFYILVTIWSSERSENDLLYIKKLPN